MSVEFRIDSDVSGLEKFSADLGNKFNAIVKATTFRVNQGMQVKIMTGPKTGRIYERGEHTVSFLSGVKGALNTGLGDTGFKHVSFTAKRGSKAKAHQASAPGESPATDMGVLVNSIQWGMISRYVGASSVGAKYGRALELGSPNGRIAPRPFLRPTIATESPLFMAKIKAASMELEGGR